MRTLQQAISANVPLAGNTIIKSDRKCDNAFIIKVHFDGENDLPQT
jgi:hypothetical protein